MSLCSACDKPFEKDEEKETTTSGMKFHVACFKKFLSTRSKTDYQVCGKYFFLLICLLEEKQNRDA